jgi:diguanylate cyclase (GGDEF)-like protein/PAS domain S-box-containing protein
MKSGRILLRRTAKAVVLATGLLPLAGVSPAAQASPDSTLRIGVLAKRGPAMARDKWTPTARYLTREVAGHRFRVVPLGFDAVVPAVRRGSVDFVLANSGYYVELEARFGVSRIATLENRYHGQGVTRFGGVIFTRADNTAIQGLKDLPGRRFKAVDARSLGGFRMAWRELAEHGIDPRRELQLSFAGTHDAVVRAVASGEAAAGTVRTDTLERMAREGAVRLSDFRLLHPQDRADFPFRVSTRLYPEWPFARLKHTDPGLAQRVAVALLGMGPDSAAAQAAHATGWSVPRNYQPVHELMEELRLGPYARSGRFTLYDVLQRYRYSLLAGALAFLAILGGAAWVAHLNRRLARSQRALQEARDNLEVRVAERTRDLEASRQETEQARREWQGAFEAIRDPIFLHDSELKLLTANQAYLEAAGVTLADAQGRPYWEVFPPGSGSMCQCLSAVAHRDTPREIHLEDGRVFLMRSYPIEDASGGLRFGVHVLEDITQRRQREEELRLAATVFENTAEGVIITAPDGSIRAANRAFTEITGYEEAEVVGRNPSLLQSGLQGESFYQAMWTELERNGLWRGEIWNRRKSGEIYPELLTISAVRDETDQISHYVAVFSDITQIKRSQQELDFLAHHDPLTELPNRLYFNQRLEQALEATDQGGGLAVLFLDLDGFKNINDSLGHPLGDELLQVVARRLAERVSEEDLVARVGGDEFLVLLESVATHEAAGTQAQHLIDAFSDPFWLQGYELSLGATVGISVYPDAGTDASTLVKNADAALHFAKANGRNHYAFYSQELTTAAADRVFLEKDLRRALERDELVVYYQPQVELATGRVVGAEALVRWQHPEWGLVSPARFIPLAEETGLIVPIGEWVLETACLQAQQWLEAGLPVESMAVNVSGVQIMRGGLYTPVARALERSGLDPGRLELEVTEETFMRDAEQASDTLEGLRELGVELAVDDFGTGYSSLAYLRRLPLDKLKIDKSFVQDTTGDSNAAAIARAVIALGQSLDLKVVAEGIETEGHAGFLQAEGCDLGQGFLYTKPLPAEELASWWGSVSR